MAGEPEVVQRADQPYVAIRALVTMQTLGTVLPGLHPEVASWLRARDVATAGAPFWKYATVRHIGHPDTLVDATRALLDWAAAQGLTWDATETDAGDRWGSRLEIYWTDPAEEPNMNNWETEPAFRLAD